MTQSKKRTKALPRSRRRGGFTHADLEAFEAALCAIREDWKKTFAAMSRFRPEPRVAASLRWLDILESALCDPEIVQHPELVDYIKKLYAGFGRLDASDPVSQQKRAAMVQSQRLARVKARVLARAHDIESGISRPLSAAELARKLSSEAQQIAKEEKWRPFATAHIEKQITDWILEDRKKRTN
jgi:hypothetical protein